MSREGTQGLYRDSFLGDGRESRYGAFEGFLFSKLIVDTLALPTFHP